ncbi:uncharacterized protein METZ01_LOCUS488988, partial [marine metagenome]
MDISARVRTGLCLGVLVRGFLGGGGPRFQVWRGQDHAASLAADQCVAVENFVLNLERDDAETVSASAVFGELG